ncbi:DNA polymerase [archaeon]|nr:DNA polymerase [archaeon]
MNYYTNVFTIGNRVCVRSIENGERKKYRDEFKPTVFIPSKDKTSKFSTIDGICVEAFQPGTIRETREFIDEYKGMSNFRVYGYAEWSNQYIGKYFDQCDFDTSKIKVCVIDIEVASEMGFPSVADVREEIIAITIQDSSTGHFYVLGREPVDIDRENVSYLHCPTEVDLLERFLHTWELLQPDVLTGWNSKMYDMPYLVRRIKSIMGDKEAKRLSVWNYIRERTVRVMNREEIVYVIGGLAQLDYLDLYKKFTYQNQESYKLDHIAFVELKEKKMSYAEHDSMHTFYKKDYQKFIEYNIKDVELVSRLEDKMKLIDLAIVMAYDAGINYEDVFGQTRYWDAMIYNHLRRKNVVVPAKPTNVDKPKLAGAYVKEIPEKGISAKWVVSFDLNSLYPHLIMQYNISPETLREDLPRWFGEMDELVKGKIDLPDVKDASMAGNGWYFRNDVQGFLPELMQQLYDDRVKYKELFLEAEKANDDVNKSKYNNRQMARKISLNSAYGAIGNEYFRYFDIRKAEAITMSGQLAIRWIERKLNEYMNQVLETDDVDYVVASDTDSVYLNMGDLVDKFLGKLTDDDKIVDALAQFSDDKVEPFIDKSYQELAEYMNSFDQRMVMKREVIADRGIWTAKKRYILNVHDSEGIRYEEPKLKIMGIEAVRSSTPSSCRGTILETMKLIMNGTETELIAFVDKFRQEFMLLPAEEISFPRSVKGLDKYYDSVIRYSKGAPIHVKGSLIHNILLKEKELSNKFMTIRNGDKIKFTYLKEPNPAKDKVIAFVNALPDEFELDSYIDRDLQFEKAYLEPIKTVLSVVGWQHEKQESLESFFV